MNNIFDRTIGRLEGFINFRSKRHEVLVSNVSNIDTPGYKPADVKFEDEMKAARLRLARTSEKHLRGRREGQNFTITPEEGSLSLEKSMTDLAENHLMHNAAVEMLARKFKSLQTVLKETR
ncbi:MAG: flagellar basal body rod protein FlgB [Syntrophales bacterium]|nr:flagellar basal body rod protein FlgB [Syntrophales bacterium]